MILGDVLILILQEARTSGLEVTCDAIKGQWDSEGWALAIRVMDQKDMIVLGR